MPQLTEHLLKEFPDLDGDEVTAQVVWGQQAAAWFGLEGEDLLFCVELVARYRLSVMDGRLVDNAKLDPQSHAGRGRSVGTAAGEPGRWAITDWDVRRLQDCRPHCR